jgi:hypothetical protein
MRYGLTISALLHVGILILVIVGLPQILKSERTEIASISVEVVSLEELTKRPAKKTPPKPVAKKPPPKEPDLPKVVKKTPPPAPPPVPAEEPLQALKILEPEPMPPEQPKPVPKPQVKPEPPPKPVPKPQVKPAPPPPKKAETKVAVKSPPAPRPKRKPKPPPPKPDEFQSLLKNLAKEKRKVEKTKADTPAKTASRPDEKPKRSALQARIMAASLVQAVNRQVTPCWAIPAGAKDAANMSVAIRIRLNPDGALGGQPKVQDSGRLGSDLFFRAVAESALRALRNPQCMPLKLPYDQYDLWKEITFVFDPKEALGQ